MGSIATYVYREENLVCLRGKLLLHEHLRANVARADRLLVGYDEFNEDTGLNRILKWTCHTLLKMTRGARVTQYLREALLDLADVEECNIEEHDFSQVHLDRGNERFRPLLDFCHIVFSNCTSTTRFGQAKSFSLVFPMEQLFEEFIGRFIKKYADDLGLTSHSIHLQAIRRRRWLMKTPSGNGHFRLKPDVVIDGADGAPAIILDTKWKRLLRDTEDVRNGVSQADIYQLYAYANRYQCRDNVLLYPRVNGVTAKSYLVDGDPSQRQIRVELVDVGRDLLRDKELLKAELRLVIHGQPSAEFDAVQ